MWGRRDLSRQMIKLDRKLINHTQSSHVPKKQMEQILKGINGKHPRGKEKKPNFYKGKKFEFWKEKRG